VLGSVDQTLQRLHDAVAGDDGDVLDRIESWLDDARLAHDEGEHQRLRYRALAADPYLRARERELLIATEEAIAAAVARELDQPTGGVGPRAFAAAVISVLLRLRERYMAMPEDAGARDEREEGFAFLRGGITALRQVGQTADS
jgi:hypothetical protein